MTRHGVPRPPRKMHLAEQPTAPCRTAARTPGPAAPMTSTPRWPAIGFSGMPLASSVRAASSRRSSTKCAGVLPVARRVAVEAALAVGRWRAERRHVELAVEMGLHPVDQRGERRVGRGLRLQQRAELRLIARPPRVEHKPRATWSAERAPEVILDDRERHVDAGGDARRGPHLAVDDKSASASTVTRAGNAARAARSRPVGRRALAVEQAGRGQHERARADRAAAPGRGATSAASCRVGLGVIAALEAARAAGDQDGVGPRRRSSPPAAPPRSWR